MKNKKVVIIFVLIFLLVLFTVFAHTFVFNIFSGRIHFPEKYVGTGLKMEDDTEKKFGYGGFPKKEG